jgi:L-rhamnose mutarotase
MERVGFTMRLLPGAEAEYRRRHAAVWPEMLDALRAAGARDYSIFLDGDRLFAYLVVDDFDAFRAAMSTTKVNDRWQAEMAALIDPQTDPATGFHRRLDEVFHLE